ncbi:MAG: hypothetical protein AAFY31_02640 [Pseudomonadota bacterium]
MNKDSISKLADAIQAYQDADNDVAAKKAHSEEIAKLLLTDVENSMSIIVAKHEQTIRNCADSLSASRTHILEEIAGTDADLQRRLKLKPALLSEIVKITETDPTEAAHRYWMKAAAPTVFGRVGITIAAMMGLVILILAALLITAWITEARINTAKIELSEVRTQIATERQMLASFTNQTNGVTITQTDGKMLLTLPEGLSIKQRAVSVLNPLLDRSRNNQYWIE